ncbi:Copper chaperone PCu(A)C [Candidatus Bealeia paramacronuclearis]|uniref:Copper chaperone PCu(A)C n=1 Tax=Candidatus Bealeia paramacronuclearis TaxID=1921001 RepID=A0ABZ2C4F6_9PROT|nr:Copper chaperone PCu(A)C [Candidatus Bealeia paramacronuclearis]
MNYKVLLSGMTISVASIFSCLNAEVTVKDPWARASTGPNSAMFMELHNDGTQDDQLIAVKVGTEKFCDRTELHAHIEENGVMKMRPVEKINIPANGSASLKPGDLHVMFMEISKPMQEADVVPITLQFASGQILDIQVPVKTAVAHKH